MKKTDRISEKYAIDKFTSSDRRYTEINGCGARSNIGAIKECCFAYRLIDLAVSAKEKAIKAYFLTASSSNADN